MASNRWFVADFETTDERFYNKHGYTRVWLYAISDPKGNILTTGSNIEDFMSYCVANLKGSTIYFHNLRFDGSFILDYLFSIGFKPDYNPNPKERTFSTLIGDMGEFYCIDIVYNSKTRLHFKDSLKLLPMTVKRIAESFKLPMLKGSIDYSDYTINETTIKYVSNDVAIVALALAEIKSHGMNKMTTASCAYNSYTAECNPKFLKYAYPDLPLDFLTTYRKAYRGGRCQVSPLYERKILNNVNRYDVNSMYPHVMRNLPLPYGEPIALSSIEQGSQYEFALYHIRIEFMLKPRHMPTLLKKGGLYSSGDSYYISSEGEEELYISSIDLELLYRHYEVLSLTFLDGYGFYTSTKMFTKYVDYWYSRKKVDVNGKRQVDKLMLTSLYGKFGTDVMKRSKHVYLDDGIVAFEYTNFEESKHYYLPVAIAVVSHAHKIIDDAIIATGYSNFVYCDTDSVHTLGQLAPELISATELGKFKLEAHEEISKYVRQKCYITQENGDMHITCAGMTESMKDTAIQKYGPHLFGIFDIGYKAEGKLLPKRVKGGIILHETTFEIKH